ncbi:hypothetical protein N7465_006289 [Penicillium sp. CMV-2018d]|nr:hypothetical protein N7465_006289 [Penicillium sp. CMV-2018d]
MELDYFQHYEHSLTSVLASPRPLLLVGFLRNQEMEFDYFQHYKHSLAKCQSPPDHSFRWPDEHFRHCSVSALTPRYPSSSFALDILRACKLVANSYRQWRIWIIWML